jgi:hypothetical protein
MNKNKEFFKNKTILQDNVRFHHSKIVKEFAKENSIEMIFSKIKSNYRKLNHNDIEKDIIESINKITSNDLNNYYKHVCKTINDYTS